MAIQLRAIKGPTGRELNTMLNERGLLRGKVQGIVNYGYGGADEHLPTLNRWAGTFNKLQELRRLKDQGVRTVPFAMHAGELRGVVLGRKLHHTRGTDIKMGPGARGDYFTQLVPKDREFRVWSFRGKHLATYEKVLEYPGRNGRHGRNREVWNWRNGYAYRFVDPEGVPKALREVGAMAVDALSLDFGAVDIIYGTDRRYYVLEVNTAPGVEGRRQGLTSLVNCIERWVNNGCKERQYA